MTLFGTSLQQSKSTKNSGSIVAPPSDFNDANAVRSSAGPTTVVNREFDENGGVTKTVTTTTTEEREYKAGTPLSTTSLFTHGGGIYYRVVHNKGTVLLSTSLPWPAVAGCSGAETFSQLSTTDRLCRYMQFKM